MNKSEMLELLKNLSTIEGYLWGVKCERKSLVFETCIDPMVEILYNKILELEDE